MTSETDVIYILRRRLEIEVMDSVFKVRVSDMQLNDGNDYKLVT